MAVSFVVGQSPKANADRDHDIELAKRVRMSLAAKRPELTRLQVSADGETIHLSGEVSSYHMRQIAIETAKVIPGVECLSDRINVRWLNDVD